MSCPYRNADGFTCTRGCKGFYCRYRDENPIVAAVKDEATNLKDEVRKWQALAEANARGWKTCQKALEREEALLSKALSGFEKETK